MVASKFIPVIPLRDAPGARDTWERPKIVVYAWGAIQLLLVSSHWQISSRLRATALRLFGASIGHGVILRPGLKVAFPWKLTIGNDSWIGDSVWFHNQDALTIGSDVVISQGTFITTGSHALAKDMALITRPVVIEDGAWITAKCVVLGGSRIGKSALVAPASVVSGVVADGIVVRGNPAQFVRNRFPESEEIG
ncbi:acetyltransferase [Arthrobacter sp. HY1533]|uniref:acetyltransferase n=1 Tax=Arthrobacter sp. HY1533 TaxID=2970919 RepID=UPI0022B9E763|nr:acetyltransferase [Arthrobacter sp. HY1533]